MAKTGKALEKSAPPGPSVLGLLVLGALGCAVIWWLSRGLSDVAALDASRSAFEQQQKDAATNLERGREQISHDESRLNDLTQQAAKLRSEIKASSEARQAAQKEQTEVEADLTAKKTELDAVRSEVARVAADQTRLTKEVVDLSDKKTALATAVTEVSQELTQLDERKTALTAEVAGLKARRDDFAMTLKNTTDANNAAQQELKKATDDLTAKLGEVTKAQTNLSRLQMEAARVQALLDQEATLKKNIDDLGKNLVDVTSKANSAMDAKDAAETELEGIRVRLEGAKNDEARVRGLLAREQELTQRIAALKADEDQAVKKAADETQKLNAAKQDALAAGQLQMQLPGLRTKQADLEKSVADLQVTLDGLNKEESGLRSARDKLKQEVDMLTTQADELTKSIQRKLKVVTPDTEQPMPQNPATPTPANSNPNP